MNWHWDLLLRIAVGAALGSIIGLERDRRGRPAGLRTHMVVALASATFMVVSTHFIEHQRYTTDQRIEVDVSRIAASIVTGIGFLGGGAIIRTGITIQGLTTAAGLWLVGAIGMAAGSGMYVVASFSTALGLIALDLMRRLEDKDDATLLHQIEVHLSGGIASDAIRNHIARAGGTVQRHSSDRDLERNTHVVTFEARLPRSLDVESLTRQLAGVEGVRYVRVGGPPGA